ncbi:hypothetical protein [Aliikangiella sp. IMCC44359]|uniref:hypothetical protein n=1 Tax=Aliikangiella sp. IMCC44359 TaxID=3459125 RepID=UPI00403A7CD9
MNIKKLKQAESSFFKQYPGGFEHPEMIKIGKKHKMDKMIEMTQLCFSKAKCRNIPTTVENMSKIVSRSSMVSMFEKPKFKDFIKELKNDEQEFLVDALVNFLHGKQQLGFEAMVDILKTRKLAKWSLLTIIPAYYSPNDEIFIKPTTVKNIIQYLEIENLVYKPTPTWAFYQEYRNIINELKTKVDSSLSSSNAAFSGFLMMSTKS